jgi:hypothetical protein
MSIATLKKKSNQLHGSIQSSKGFSLNGVHRNLPYVGQTMVGRHFPRTLMHGDTARGHGGCCGTYKTNPIIHAIEVDSTEDTSVVKTSVVNTNGMTAMKYRWARRPYPYATVKPNNTIQTSPYIPFCST